MLVVETIYSPSLALLLKRVYEFMQNRKENEIEAIVIRTATSAGVEVIEPNASIYYYA